MLMARTKEVPNELKSDQIGPGRGQSGSHAQRKVLSACTSSVSGRYKNDNSAISVEFNKSGKAYVTILAERWRSTTG